MEGFKEAPDRTQISHICFDSHCDPRKRSNSNDHKYISQGLILDFFFMSLIYSTKICYFWNFAFLDFSVGEKVKKILDSFSLFF